jgi:hypothetical protein
MKPNNTYTQDIRVAGESWERKQIRRLGMKAFLPNLEVSHGSAGEDLGA